MRREGKQTSSVCMTMVQSSGQWLNGAMVPQHHFVSLTLNDPEGKIVARASLTFEQVTRMLMYNGEVECTLERYRGPEGTLVEEKVERPKTVHARMKDRMGTSRSELGARINDLYKDIYAIINSGSGSAGKKKLQELLNDVHTIQSHFGSNDDFVLQQAEEELSAMQTQAVCQLGVFLQTQHGIEADETTLKKLLPVSDANLLTDKSESAVPVVTGYKPKARKAKSIDDMTATEVADGIKQELSRLEASMSKSEKSQLFGAGAIAGATSPDSKVIVWYISYQGKHKLELDLAKAYLKILKVASKDTFKKHFELGL